MQQRMDLSARRDLNNGFGDALSRAFEFAATPAIFGGVGYLIDQWLDTTPIFTIVLALWAVVGSTVLWWYRYDAKMQQIEAELVARRDIGQHGEGTKAVDVSTDSKDSKDSKEQPAAAAAAQPVISDGLLPTGVTLEGGPR